MLLNGIAFAVLNKGIIKILIKFKERRKVC